MRFLYLVFAAFLLVSLAAPGCGEILKYCPKVGHCSPKCSTMEIWGRSLNCKMHCCLPAGWKWK
ncbi:meleagrin-like [Numida meleagris]|uniref:meleagrin-like n=1 Tax=Numida meleagris TaxID=8996 RepID=UPI000B3DBAB5|nr:meleagrin-like [Numida meleagris]